MIIDIDIGNTRVKYRVTGEAVMFCGQGEIARIIGDKVKAGDPCLVRIASVAANPVIETLLASLATYPQLQVMRVVSARYCAGVTSSYALPEKLGVDRWLAMIAAYNRFRAPVLVIDAGSAVTLDVVDAAGHHEGGWICPGLELMRTSLLQGTAGVRFETSDQFDVSLGRSTAEAVCHGTLAMMIGWLNSAVIALLEKYRNAHIVLCGGDANTLRGHLEFPCVMWPDVVLDGLALVPINAESALP